MVGSTRGLQEVLKTAVAAGVSPAKACEALASGMQCAARGHPLLVSPRYFNSSAELRRVVADRVILCVKEGDKHGPVLSASAAASFCPVCRDVTKRYRHLVTPGTATLSSGVGLDVLRHCCRPVVVQCLGATVQAELLEQKHVDTALWLWGRGRKASAPSLLEVAVRFLKEASGGATIRALGAALGSGAGAGLQALTDLSLTDWLRRAPAIFRVERCRVTLLSSLGHIKHSPVSERMTSYVRGRSQAPGLMVSESYCKVTRFDTPQELVAINTALYGQHQWDESEDAVPHVVAVQRHLQLLQQQEPFDIPIAMMVVLEFVLSEPPLSVTLYLDSSAHLFVKPTDQPGLSFREVVGSFYDSYLETLPSRDILTHQLSVVAPDAEVRACLAYTIGRAV